MNTEYFGLDTSMLSNIHKYLHIKFSNNGKFIHVEIAKCAKCQQFNAIQN